MKYKKKYINSIKLKGGAEVFEVTEVPEVSKVPEVTEVPEVPIPSESSENSDVTEHQYVIKKIISKIIQF